MLNQLLLVLLKPGTDYELPEQNLLQWGPNLAMYLKRSQSAELTALCRHFYG